MRVRAAERVGLGDRQNDHEQAGREGGQTDDAWHGHRNGLSEHLRKTPTRRGNDRAGMVSEMLTPHTGAACDRPPPLATPLRQRMGKAGGTPRKQPGVALAQVVPPCSNAAGDAWLRSNRPGARLVHPECHHLLDFGAVGGEVVVTLEHRGDPALVETAFGRIAGIA